MPGAMFNHFRDTLGEAEFGLANYVAGLEGAAAYGFAECGW